MYELRHFDTPLLRFETIENASEFEVSVKWVNEEKRYLLPLDVDGSDDSVHSWLKHRTIPKNRAYVRNFLNKCGLDVTRQMNIIRVSKGLSLNDCYWVVEEDFDGTFDQFNLYDNKFSRTLSLIAFTGYGSNDSRTSLASCPEFTTAGMLPKGWRRVNGIKLYKGGTVGASNTGNEPYSEFYAAKIAKTLEVNAIDYSLSMWKDTLCSVCDLFTSKEYSFVSAGRVVRRGGLEAVIAYYESLGEEYITALNDMFVFDAVICNTDRHYGNFGFLVDNQTNKIVAPAPLFDHGNSLFNYAGNDSIESEKALDKYIKELWPRVYDDFFDKSLIRLTRQNREGLRRLTSYKIPKHSRYNLPEQRLKMIEKQVQKRARKLLEI